MLSKCGPQNPNQTKLSDTRHNDGMLVLMWFVLPDGGHNGTHPSLSFPSVEWSPLAAPSPVDRIELNLSSKKQAHSLSLLRG